MDKSFLKEQRCIDFLRLFKPGEYIYPDVVVRNLRICKQDAVDFLEMLVEDGICERMHRHYCPICMKCVGPFIQHIYDEIYCDCCDSVLKISDVKVCYMVKNKGSN